MSYEGNADLIGVGQFKLGDDVWVFGGGSNEMAIWSVSAEIKVIVRWLH